MSAHPTSGTHAVVIGASMAGLLAARVLSERFDNVTIVDRDTLPGAPRPRKGVPQGRHAHALLAAGERVLSDLFPGIVADLIADGAVLGDQMADVRWWQFDGYRTRNGQSLTAVCCSRPLLEGHVRRHLMARSNVRIIGETRAKGLVHRRRRVVGVMVDDGCITRDLAADLVVDCSGRGSQVGAWLEQLGYATPEVSRVHMDMSYATRVLRRTPDDLPDARVAVCVTTPPAGKRAAYLVPVEADRWICTLAGLHGERAPSDEAGFAGFVDSLPADDIARVVRRAEPLTEVMTHRMPCSQWRHMEKVDRVPVGFVTMGDSICSFDPIYGQGMTSAALQAEALARCLDRHPVASPRFARAFYRDAAKVVKVPWQIAAGGDFAFPETTGPKPPGTDLVNRYMGHVFRAAQRDPVVARAVIDVQNLLAAPPSLLRPAMMLRVARMARGTERAETSAPVSEGYAPAWSGWNASTGT
jgi:2-polyprenyl-6-methoxyphenol hydroxylase-like FAD-dependent oxidoreductase